MLQEIEPQALAVGYDVMHITGQNGAFALLGLAGKLHYCSADKEAKKHHDW